MGLTLVLAPAGTAAALRIGSQGQTTAGEESSVWREFKSMTLHKEERRKVTAEYWPLGAGSWAGGVAGTLEELSEQ